MRPVRGAPGISARAYGELVSASAAKIASTVDSNRFLIGKTSCEHGRGADGAIIMHKAEPGDNLFSKEADFLAE